LQRAGREGQRQQPAVGGRRAVQQDFAEVRSGAGPRPRHIHVILTRDIKVGTDGHLRIVQVRNRRVLRRQNGARLERRAVVGEASQHDAGTREVGRLDDVRYVRVAGAVEFDLRGVPQGGIGKSVHRRVDAGCEPGVPAVGGPVQVHVIPAQESIVAGRDDHQVVGIRRIDRDVRRVLVGGRVGGHVDRETARRGHAGIDLVGNPLDRRGGRVAGEEVVVLQTVHVGDAQAVLLHPRNRLRGDGDAHGPAFVGAVESGDSARNRRERCLRAISRVENLHRLIGENRGPDVGAQLLGIDRAIQRGDGAGRIDFQTCRRKQPNRTGAGFFGNPEHVVARVAVPDGRSHKVKHPRIGQPRHHGGRGRGGRS